MNRLIVTVGIVLAVVACSANVSMEPDESPAADLIRVHDSASGGGMDAIVQGVVDVDLELGCVFLSNPDGTRHPVVWPAGTAAHSEPFEIVLPDGQAVSEGDEVSGGGGYVPADSATGSSPPFPDSCVQDGDAAVFNSNASLQVRPDVGVEIDDTLVDRFSVPESLGLELIAVNPNARSVAVADFVGGTVHLYEQYQYASPEDAIAGASGGGGYIHLWADGEIRSYPGEISGDPLVYEPDSLRRVPGIAPTLEVVPAPDGERTWLIQDGGDEGPTLVEVVNLVEVQVARLGSFEIDGSWQPAGTTTEGLVLVSNDGGVPRSILVGSDGSVINRLAGDALAVGWNGAAIRGDDGELFVTDASFESKHDVDKPDSGHWMSVGMPLISTTAPPLRTGGEDFVLGLIKEPEHAETSSGQLVVVDASGTSRSVYELDEGQRIATLSRVDDQIAVIEENGVTLVPIDGSEPASIGDVIPDEHWVLTAG